MSVLLALFSSPASAVELDFASTTTSCSAAPWAGSPCLTNTVGGADDSIALCDFPDDTGTLRDAVYIVGSATSTPNWIALPTTSIASGMNYLDTWLVGVGDSCDSQAKGQIDFLNVNNVVISTIVLGPVDLDGGPFSLHHNVTIPTNAKSFRIRAGFLGTGGWITQFRSQASEDEEEPGSCTYTCPDGTTVPGINEGGLCTPYGECPSDDSEDPHPTCPTDPEPVDPFPTCPV